MLQNLIKILMFLTVLLMSTSSLHLNQNRIIPVELSTLNSYRRQQLPPSTLLNDHHHYHNDQYHQTRSIRDRQHSKRSQQQQQHRVVKSIELNDDDDDFSLINSEYLPQLHRYQQFQEQQQQQQQQQQQFHPKIFHTQQISNSRNNNIPPTSSFFNSHNQFNGRFTGSSLPSSTIISPYDYRDNLLNYRHRTPSIPIYKQEQQQEQLQQHQQEQLLPISTHRLIQHHPSLPLNMRGNVDEGGGSSSSSITINNDFIENGNNRDSTGGIGLGDNENFIRIGIDNINDDTAITGHRNIVDENRIQNSNNKNILTSDDIDNLMMLNDDVYSGYDPSEKFIKNSDIIIKDNNKNNKNTGGGTGNNPYYDTNTRNSQNGVMNSNEINNSNKNSLSNSNINNNNQFQLQPPKALQELFQQQQQQQQKQKTDKQLNTNALQLKLASLGQQTSSIEEYDNIKDDYTNRRLSSGSLGSSTSLDNRIKKKEQKIKAELLKHQQQLKRVTGKSGKQNEQKGQKMQKDQQVNNDDDSFINSDTLLFQKDNKELNSNNKKQQNQNKLKNNNNSNNNNKQQKRQQKKDLQQANKRNVVGLQSSISPVSHSIANQLMLRNTRGQRQYDVPQIECPSAMDGMERFACPSPDRQGRYRCIDDHVLCDGFIDCPEGEDEERSSCMFYKTTKAHLDVLADALLRWARGR